MKVHRFQFSLLLAAITAVCVIGTGHAASPPREYYSIIDLGTLGGNVSRAYWINNAGQVVGYAMTATGDKRAFRTAASRPINPATDDLGTLGGSTSVAKGINDSGQVVGYAYTAAGAQHGFRTAPNSAINSATDDLLTLGGPASEAVAINSLGQVAGYSDSEYYGGSWDMHAFRTAPNSPINPATDDLKVVGASWGVHQAFNINDAGQVVGQINSASGALHAFRTAPGSPIAPATDDLNVFWSGSSIAWGINSVGQVVGRAYTNPNDPGSGPGQAFRTAANSPILSATDLLGTLGGVSSTALSINKAGQVVGFADTVAAGVHAFVWEDAQGMTDLNNLIPSCSGWTLIWATAINEAGQIVGRGYHNGNERAFLLTPAPVKLIGLEVTQVVQDWQNSVPLAAGKETWVRAHIQAMGATNNVLVNARLHGTDLSNGDLSPAFCDPWSLLLAKTNAADSAVRADLSSTLNFQLPPEWCTGAVVLTLETTAGVPFQACGEPAEPNGSPCDGQVKVSFRSSAYCRVTFVPFGFFDPVTQTTHSVSDADIEELVNRLRAIYPLARSWGRDNGVTVKPTQWLYPVPMNGPNLDEGTFMTLINERVNLLYTNSLSPPELYYAVWKGPPWGGGGVIGGSVTMGALSPNPWVYMRNNHAHELGHLLGRPHPSDAVRRYCDPGCPVPADPVCEGCQRGTWGETVEVKSGDWPKFPFYFIVPSGSNNAVLGPMDQGKDKLMFGLDTSTSTNNSPPTIVAPTEHFELMSYCGSDASISQWISSFTYTNLWNAMQARFPSPPPARPPPPPEPPQPYLLIRGIIDQTTDATTLLPFGAITSTTPPSLLPGGNYLLQLLDGAGGIIQQVAFQPRAWSDTVGGQAAFASFLIPVPANPAIKLAVIFHNTTVLASRAASPHPPQVTILSPNGGENLAGGSVTVQWTASDMDGDALTYAVLYSTDASATWQALAVDLTNQQFVVSTDYLKGTLQGRFKVIASDGFQTATAESTGLFTVANHAPRVTISRPADGQLFSGSQLVPLVADARDQEDGYLSGASLKWFSSIQGTLGQGEALSLTATALTEGSHRVTVVATDRGGLTTTAAVHVVVSRIDPANVPTLKITAVNGQPRQRKLSYEPMNISRSYTPQFTSNLVGAVWSTLATVSGPQTNGNQVTLTDTNAIEPRKFYRLRITPP